MREDKKKNSLGFKSHRKRFLATVFDDYTMKEQNLEKKKKINKIKITPSPSSWFPFKNSFIIHLLIQLL